MILSGQLALLFAFVGSGYAAFACVVGNGRDRRQLVRSGEVAGVAGIAALTVATAVLAWALVVKDFRFAYVTQYSNRLLPWHYSLSALWVGQAGSLLFWSWVMGLVALVYRFWPGPEPSSPRSPTFGLLLGYVWFLTAVMVFAADPMESNLEGRVDGVGRGCNTVRRDAGEKPSRQRWWQA